MCGTDLKLNPQGPNSRVRSVLGRALWLWLLEGTSGHLGTERRHIQSPSLTWNLSLSLVQMCPPMLCCSQWKFRLKPLRCSLTDSGGTSQAVGQGHTSSSSPPWWQSILPVGFSCLVCSVYLIKVQPLQLVWNSRHVFILISACCQQVFP